MEVPVSLSWLFPLVSVPDDGGPCEPQLPPLPAARGPQQPGGYSLPFTAGPEHITLFFQFMTDWCTYLMNCIINVYTQLYCSQLTVLLGKYCIAAGFVQKSANFKSWFQKKKYMCCCWKAIIYFYEKRGIFCNIYVVCFVPALPRNFMFSKKSVNM